jgi:cytochrome c oxidase subunit 2
MDAPNFWQIGFQDPATPIMEGIIEFHNHLMVFLIAIASFVLWLLFRCLNYYGYHGNIQTSLSNYDEDFTHSTVLEVVWTIVPALILMVIAVPSFALLYSIDEVIVPAITLKVIGHQWYWTYEYSDYSDIDGNSISFDSYMVADDDLEQGQLRLLEVDNRVILPANTHIRALVTAVDVLHSWAIPSLGVKMDACPGRLNQVSMFIKREGTFYGQCSEICGVQHGFMPIVVQAVSIEDYVKWVSVQTECKNWLANKLKSINKSR